MKTSLFLACILVTLSHAANIRGGAGAWTGGGSSGEDPCKGRKGASDKTDLWCSCTLKKGLITETNKESCDKPKERVNKCTFEGGKCVSCKVEGGKCVSTKAAPGAATPAGAKAAAAPAPAPAAASKVQQMAAKIDAGKLGTDDTKKIAKDLGTGNTDAAKTTKAPAPAPAAKLSAAQEVTAAQLAPGGECEGRKSALDSSDLWCKCSLKNGLITKEDPCAKEPEREGKCKFERGGCVSAKAAPGSATPAGTTTAAAAGAKPAAGTTTAQLAGATAAAGAKPGTKAPAPAPAAAGAKPAAGTTAPVDGKPAAAPAGGGGLSPEFEKDAEAKGNTCETKTPYGDKKGKKDEASTVLANEKDLTALYKGCLKAAGSSKMFVIYPNDANEQKSNCWLCSSEAVRPSKMKKAFLFKVSSLPVPAGTTCVTKTPVKDDDTCTKVEDLGLLKAACEKLAKKGGKKMFVIYPKVIV